MTASPSFGTNVKANDDKLHHMNVELVEKPLDRLAISESTLTLPEYPATEIPLVDNNQLLSTSPTLGPTRLTTISSRAVSHQYTSRVSAHVILMVSRPQVTTNRLPV